MSIYGTVVNFMVEDEEHGGSFDDAWHEVWIQAVPNHINEQNGYGGPGWDDWLPAFVHKPGCVQRVQVFYDKPAEGSDVDWIRQACSPDDPQARRDDYHDCECGDRAYFVCDKFTTKGTARNGQEYVNPVMVLTGPEYDALSWTEMLIRLEEAVAERGPKVMCKARGCGEVATNITYRNKTVSQARCDAHWTAYVKRRKPAIQSA